MPAFAKNRRIEMIGILEDVYDATRIIRRFAWQTMLFLSGGFMPVPRFVAWIFPVGMMVLGTGAVSGQNYPNKPLRIVVSGPGNSADLAARLVAQGIAGPLGQQVVVDNRGSGVIPGEIVSRASPDGYALLVAGGTFWTGPLFQNVPFDPVKDFSPITLISMTPNTIV